MMKPSVGLMEKFYQQLGRVFFLVANADKHIHENEVAALKKIVNDVWLDHDHTFDELETDTGYQIEYMFDFLIANPKSENAILDDFTEFVSDYKDLFTIKANMLIVGTGQAIADAFAGTNKEEQRILDKIKLILS